MMSDKEDGVKEPIFDPKDALQEFERRLQESKNACV